MAIDGKLLGSALSGGGYRAALFGLGSLWRLNEAGLLGRLDRITSVSGGSILAGVLAQRWTKLVFDNGRASNFESEIAVPLDAFCARSIDVGVGIRGIANPFKSAGEYLEGCYEKHLFGRTLVRELPQASEGHPKFIFHATNLQTGRSFRFRQDVIADWMLGVCPSGQTRLRPRLQLQAPFHPCSHRSS